MTDKQIIKKFSDGHCLVLENNQISLREDELTAYRIVLGKSTNELLEFVKNTYLQLDQLKQTLAEIKEIAENREIFCENCSGGVESFTCDDCGYVKILQKIRECEGNNEQ